MGDDVLNFLVNLLENINDLIGSGPFLYLFGIVIGLFIIKLIKYMSQGHY